MLRKALTGLGLAFAVLAPAVWWLTHSTRYAIDRSVSIAAPSSPKSRPETYRPGYVPPLVYSEEREPCAGRTDLKQALFGDLHIHTALSADAYPDGTRVFPDTALAFARGEEIALATEPGQPEQRVRLSRPLDFAAITDHSESIGEGYICRTPGAFPGYGSSACRTFRAGEESGLRIFTTVHAGTRPARKRAVCGEDDRDCHAAARIVWKQTIEASEAAYDRTQGCAFTTLIGYEYTRSPNGMHMHRNTIFRNMSVPAEPGNFIDYPTLPDLLGKLERECRAGIEACDVISIPHNSNLSSGNAFNPDSLQGFSEEARQAHRLQRQSFDRLMEITQHKGTSECLSGVTDILGDEDEYCDIEAIRTIGRRVRAFDITVWIPRLYRTTLRECTGTDLDPKDNLYKGPCVSSRDFARGAWLEGLKEARHSHVNPFQMGVIGSTDSHIGTGGNTGEADWPGHIVHETTLDGRLGAPGLGRHNRIEGNPGGLAGVWAVENSRDAIFQSLKRRETFATSGTRIRPRFFAGDYPDDLCAQGDRVALAYEKGVPMGAEIPSPPGNGLRFYAEAARDDVATASPLQEIQVIKGWIDAEGNKRSSVKTVAAAGPGGAANLCAVYEDPDHDPSLYAYYYLRVIELPSPRWSTVQCNAAEPGDRPEACAGLPDEMIHEMAWTSPVWLVPETSG